MNIQPITTIGAPLQAAHIEAVREAINNDKAANTRRVYAGAQAEFENWLAVNGYTAGPQSAAAYLTALNASGIKTSTLRAKLAAIVARWPEAGRHEAVRATLRGIMRQRAENGAGNNSTSKAALTLADLRGLCDREPRTLTEIRDRALVLVGFWMAARRSELVAVNVEDVRWVRSGFEVTVRKSKTDQMGDGRVVPIAAMKDRCVDAAYWLRRWLEVSGVKSGAVFVGTTRHGKTTGKRLTAQVVALIVKRTLARAGIASELFAAHSLRSGFVTSARAIGLDDHHTKNVSRHKTDKMLNHYDKRDSREAMAAISEAFNGQ